jgi:hypothetical protein
MYGEIWKRDTVPPIKERGKDGCRERKGKLVKGRRKAIKEEKMTRGRERSWRKLQGKEGGKGRRRRRKVRPEMRKVGEKYKEMGERKGRRKRRKGWPQVGREVGERYKERKGGKGGEKGGGKEGKDVTGEEHE